MENTIWKSLDTLVYVGKSRYRREILERLNKPKTPARLAEETRLYISHVSRALRELVRAGLVECVNAGASRNRVYRRTRAGERLFAPL